MLISKATTSAMTQPATWYISGSTHSTFCLKLMLSLDVPGHVIVIICSITILGVLLNIGKNLEQFSGANRTSNRMRKCDLFALILLPVGEHYERPQLNQV